MYQGDAASGSFRLALRFAPALAVVAVALAAAVPARAQSFALSRFEPSERGSRFFVADSLELQHGARPSFALGIPASYALRSRTFGDAREGERSRLVEHALYLHPGASVVLAPGLRFAIDLPIAAIQQGESTVLVGKLTGAPASPRLGDLRASIDLPFVGPASRDEPGVAIAGGVSVWLPTGSDRDYAGDSGTRFGVHVTSAAHFGWLLATARVGYMYRRDGDLGGSRLGSELTTAMGVAWTDRVWTVGPELHGATLLYDPLATRTTPVEVLAGAHRSLGPFRLGLAVGTSLVSGLGAAHLRTLLSLEWVPALAPADTDRDHDGVVDTDDACPDAPGVPELRGCPAVEAAPVPEPTLAPDPPQE